VDPGVVAKLTPQLFRQQRLSMQFVPQVFLFAQHWLRCLAAVNSCDFLECRFGGGLYLYWQSGVFVALSNQRMPIDAFVIRPYCYLQASLVAIWIYLARLIADFLQDL